MAKESMKRNQDRERVAQTEADSTKRGAWEHERLLVDPDVRKVIDRFAEKGLSMADVQLMQARDYVETRKLIRQVTKQRANALAEQKRRKTKGDAKGLDGNQMPGLKTIATLKGTALQELKHLRLITQAISPTGDVGKRPAKLPAGMDEKAIIERVKARKTDEIIT